MTEIIEFAAHNPTKPPRLVHVQKVNVRQCDLFGHVQIFWSYSSSHVKSEK